MKKQLLLAGALLSLTQTHAQSIFRHQHASSPKNHQILNGILHSQSVSNNQQKPTTLHQRVVAQATEIALPGNGIDSATFRYTGAKGSEFDWNSLNYSYSTDYSNLYDPLFRFPGSPDPMDVLADSIRTYTDGDMTWMGYAHYRSDRKIDSLTTKYNDGTGNFFAAKDYNFYNTQGALVKTYNLQEFTPGTLDTFMLKTYTYNSAVTRVERDSTWITFFGTTQLVSITTYHYGSSNKLDSMQSWDVADPSTISLNTTIKFTYNSSGKVSTVKAYDHTSGAPLPSFTDTIGYTSGVDYMTYFQEDYYDTDGSYSDGTREVKYPGASGLPDSVRVFQREDAASAYEYFATLLPEYNSYDNPENFYITLAMTGTDTIGRFSFYYETWDDGLSVKPVSNNKDFSVYPNPFINTIGIDWKGAQQQKATIRLMNAAGQEVFNTIAYLVPGKNSFTLPAALNSGNYILIIGDTKGKIWSNKMVKQ